MLNISILDSAINYGIGTQNGAGWWCRKNTMITLFKFLKRALVHMEAAQKSKDSSNSKVVAASTTEDYESHDFTTQEAL